MLWVGYSRADTSFKCNGLCTKTNLRGMLQEKYFCMVDMVFSFLAGFVDSANVLIGQATITRFFTMYSNLTNF